MRKSIRHIFWFICVFHKGLILRHFSVLDTILSTCHNSSKIIPVTMNLLFCSRNCGNCDDTNLEQNDLNDIQVVSYIYIDSCREYKSNILTCFHLQIL